MSLDFWDLMSLCWFHFLMDNARNIPAPLLDSKQSLLLVVVLIVVVVFESITKIILVYKN